MLSIDQLKKEKEALQLPQVINRKVANINSNNNFIATFSGEGKTAYTVMREEHTDVKAFPKHHPSGRFGLNHPRKIRLSQQMYFNQRLLNQDKRFAKDPCYLFMASYYIERQAVERQINISGMFTFFGQLSLDIKY